MLAIKFEDNFPSVIISTYNIFYIHLYFRDAEIDTARDIEAQTNTLEDSKHGDYETKHTSASSKASVARSEMRSGPKKIRPLSPGVLTL